MSSSGGSISSWVGGHAAAIVIAVVAAGAGVALVPVVTGNGGSNVVAPPADGTGDAPVPTVTGDAALPALGVPSCAPGATNVTTSSAASSNLASGNNVCVTANIGSLTLTNQTSGTTQNLGSSGSGIIDELDLNNVDFMTVSVRAHSIHIRGGSASVTVQSSKLGGNSATDRVNDQIIEMLDTLDGTSNVVIQDTDIGWTCADNGGNTGYGIRAYGTNDNLLISRNFIHDLAADGIQGVNGANVKIDRNEIARVGQCPGSDEHSDVIQFTGNDAGTEVTNNWFHQQGYFDSGSGAVAGGGGAGNIYVHGGSTGSLLINNNLFSDSRGRTEFCGLGTGGEDRQNLTVTDNTWYDLGQRTDGSFPGMEWDCDTGSSNLFANNIGVDPHGGLDDGGAEGSVATFTNNIWGTLTTATFDADLNCTSVNCNGATPIGYRKPSGVHW